METDDYLGIFVNDGEPPKSMTVYDSDMEPPEPVKRMTLQYTDDDGTFGCSVFFIFSAANTITDEMGTCEMYVRDSRVQEGPSDSCQTFFKQRCNTTKIYQPYSASCKTTEDRVNGDDKDETEGSS
ncbi:uncharacterized protein LOC142564526 [Dermacentor variabilis]|uniref:uncharacterized protein LOC142564526 n=1 Tax=Dermacentor variabilis TaxID=34621 RepID=UPI003F5C4735